MGYKVKEVRKQKHMTQEELSKKSGVSRGTISSLENGSTRCVMVETLVKLADAMGVSLEEIFFT